MLQTNNSKALRLRHSQMSDPLSAMPGSIPIGSDHCSGHGIDIPFLLSSYKTLGLSDLNKTKLMDRTDTKYILPASWLSELLERLQTYFSLLEVNGHRVFMYQNTYFDSDDREFYRMHHNGLRPRYKVRLRKYLETGVSFIEVKKKTNKNKTIKRRMKIDNGADVQQDVPKFARHQLPRKINDISPHLYVGFHRITLANERAAERLTIDSGIHYQLCGHSSVHQLNHILIAELKKDREVKLSSPFCRLMRRFRVMPSRFSKYCIGCNLLYNGRLKANRFKFTMKHLQKLRQKEGQLL